MRNKANAWWFFVAFLGGGAGVWWTKSVSSNPWFAAMVAAGVVLALITYYLLNDEDAPEEEGDNVYYLGLLFTLISLMFTLVELFGDTDTTPNAEKIRALLENFGIALTSTVVGIAGRVALQNWQRTGASEITESADDMPVPSPPPTPTSPGDLEKFNRHILGRIARDLTQGANALARFHRIVRGHASNSELQLRNHSETLKQESAAFQAVLQRNAETFAQELKSQAENTFEAVRDSLGAATKQAEALLERLQSAQEDHLAEVREMTRSFHDEIRSASGQSLDALRLNFDTAAKQAEALPGQVRSVHDGYVAEVRETTRLFHEEIRSASSQNLDALRGNFEAAAEQWLALTQNVSSVHERIGSAFDSLGSGRGHASDASTAFGSSTQQAAESAAALEAEVNKLRADIAQLHAAAQTMTSVLASVGELDARIRASHDTEQTAAAVRQIGESLQTIAADGTAATEQATKAAELFDALTRSIRATEDETRRAAQALRTLTNEAEERAKALRRHQGSGFKFWNRNR